MEAPLLLAEVPSKYFDYLLQWCPKPPIKRTTIMNTFEMYQQVRKLNPDLYWNPKTQLQMKLDAQAMGKEFFRKEDLKLVEAQT